jgi:hypothetical protein
VPDYGTPIGCKTNKPAPWAKDTVDLSQRFFNVSDIFDNLDGASRIEFAIAIRQVGRIGDATLNPRKCGAALARRRNLIGADVDRSYPAVRPNELSDFVRIGPTPTAYLKHALSGAEVESVQDGVSPNHYVGALRQCSLEPARFIIKRKVCHGLSSRVVPLLYHTRMSVKLPPAPVA